MLSDGAGGGGAGAVAPQVTVQLYVDGELVRSQMETVQGESTIGRVISRLGYGR